MRKKLLSEKVPGVWVIQDDNWEYKYTMNPNKEDNMIELNTNNFDTEVTNTDKLLFIHCYATWCKVCEMASPIFQELAHEFNSSVKFCKFNVEDSPRLTEEKGITAIPTVLVIREGIVHEQIIGLKSKQEYASVIRNNFSDGISQQHYTTKINRGIDFKDKWREHED